MTDRIRCADCGAESYADGARLYCGKCYDAMKSLLPCGHPAACKITFDGERYCGWCASIEKERFVVNKMAYDAGFGAATERAAMICEKRVREISDKWLVPNAAMTVMLYEIAEAIRDTGKETE